MRKIYKLLSVALLSTAVFTSCSSDDELSSSSLLDLTIETELSDLDLWIDTTFTEPYNIDVLYKWDRAETDYTKYLVPPATDKVQPFMQVIKRAWMDAWIEAAGMTFFKSYVPKQFLLVGSGGYDSDGSVVQGQAENARKISLYEVNDFDFDDYTSLKRYVHVIHHEFSHILQQNVEQDPDYQYISSYYTVNWTSYSDFNASNTEWSALHLGTITAYGLSAAEEDYVEMIATILTNTEDEYETYIRQVLELKDASVPYVEGGDLDTYYTEDSLEPYYMIKAKEEMIVTYMSQYWNIDLYEFRDVSLAAMNDALAGEF